MSFLNKVFREILKIKPFFQSLGRFRLGVGVSFSADTPVTGSHFDFLMSEDSSDLPVGFIVSDDDGDESVGLDDDVGLSFRATDL